MHFVVVHIIQLFSLHIAISSSKLQEAVSFGELSIKMILYPAIFSDSIRDKKFEVFSLILALFHVATGI